MNEIVQSLLKYQLKWTAFCVILDLPFGSSFVSVANVNELCYHQFQLREFVIKSVSNTDRARTVYA